MTPRNPGRFIPSEYVRLRDEAVRALRRAIVAADEGDMTLCQSTLEAAQFNVIQPLDALDASRVYPCAA